MVELNISPDFTIEDIHKIREYNYEITKDMTANERRNYYKTIAEKAKEKIEQFKKELH
jgi:hypothetical protein